MIRSLKEALIPALAAALLAAPAWAQQPMQPPQPAPQAPADPAEAAFRSADTNKDGQLSREEAAKLPAIAARFDELDKNKDGALSWEEFRAGQRAAP
ncbi:EF-hand domain-containing protein [Aquincola sp. S2]|uniref:EF-hand domain-containing protein n=1 Tax=Pseudaquabacterium terrae TaxID=2732868 RepID=A0ABX2EL47_9BURK|nr:EF-hand domain-containing protein [Aquabacterium terrae]NRF69381.1 EF-hand domain-containing protein [Aquabacterium terrae]